LITFFLILYLFLNSTKKNAAWLAHFDVSFKKHNQYDNY